MNRAEETASVAVRMRTNSSFMRSKERRNSDGELLDEEGVSPGAVEEVEVIELDGGARVDIDAENWEADEIRARRASRLISRLSSSGMSGTVESCCLYWVETACWSPL